ncbi:MAG: alpha/beta hydrolase [Verrucomicrobia bacterium]|nr:MAG: alpha/beta hydrolase [Verrucomicrobiota bacterium]
MAGVALVAGWLAGAVHAGSALEELRAWLAQPPDQRPALTNAPWAEAPLTREEAAEARRLLWADHVRFIRETRKAEMQAKVIELDGLRMKFELLQFLPPSGGAPTNGWSLFFSLHGGGGAPKRVNDSQWRNQIRLARAYRPREGFYLAPRAPTDTWNLWHQAHIDRFFDRLIENLIVLAGVNPNRVYVFGYSAGGDGVYQLAPRMADRWAAAAMMAGHPNDASPLGLRNVPFALQVGADDAAYHRNEVAAEWGRRLDELQRADPEGYRHLVKLHEGKGHWMDLEDRQAIPWMEQFTRNPIPDRVVWHQDDVTHTRFYWLEVPPEEAKPGRELIAERHGQEITLTTDDYPVVTVLLDDRMMDLDRPVTIRAGDRRLFKGKPPRTIRNLADTLAGRGDPELMFSAAVTVRLD